MAGDAAVAAVFEPVRTPTTFEETVERLGTAIRLGILAPGSRLPPERELAEIAHPPQVLRHSNADHARLIDALARGDGTGALRALRLHLEGTEHVLAGLTLGGPGDAA